MTKKEELLLKALDGKTDEEKKEYLEKEYNLRWNFAEGPFKFWQAKLFTYCFQDEFEDELNWFLFLYSLAAIIYGFCFEPEEPTFLGCTCPCGNKQTLVYYSITYGD
ncbi:hypothetical protein [Anaerotignum sp.]|uniref:hypothetical protein n=1 Tax=Anaerotignum sp. TaxID=2039241 RepID=UPI003325FF63